MDRTRLIFAVCLACALAACGGETDSSSRSEVEPVIASPASSRTLGFVLVDFSFEQPDRPENACPEGWNLNEHELAVERLEATDPEAASQLPPGFKYILALRAEGGTDPCQDLIGREGVLDALLRPSARRPSANS